MYTMKLNDENPVVKVFKKQSKQTGETTQEAIALKAERAPAT